jgi:sialidase-1
VETDGEIIPMPEVQKIYQNGSVASYRIPALLKSKRGTLLAFAEARRTGVGDTGDIDTVVKRSEDGGKTWGDEIVVFDEQDNVAGNPCPVVDQSTGRIWSLQTWNNHQVHENLTKAGFGEDSRRVFVTYSDDDGKTWAKAKDITAMAKKKDWSWYATGPGVGIQLQRGKYKGRLIIPCDHKALPEGGPQTYHSHILYSDNHGETWQIGAVTEHGRNECTAVELEDGSVLLNSRVHGSGAKEANTRGVSISRDGGKTFDESFFSKDLIDAHCQGAMTRYRWKKGNKPGVIAFTNQAWPWRSYLMARFSYDDGKTWPAARVIYPHTSAYSSVATLSDGSLGVLFEKDYWDTISFAIVPVPKLPNTKKRFFHKDH